MKLGKIKFSTFYKDVFKLAGGTALAQLIPFIAIPILTRYYSEEDFGTLTLYISFSLLLAKIGSGKFEFAIVLEEEEKEKINLVTLASVFLLGFSLLYCLVIFIFNDSFFTSLGLNSLGNFIYLIPITIISFGGFEICNYWLNSNKKYGSMAIGKVFQNTSSEGYKISGTYLNLNGGALIHGKVLGEIIGMLFVLSKSWKGFKTNFKYINLTSIIRLGKKHKKFLIYTTPSVLLGALINFVYISLFIKFYGKEFVGNIGIASQYIVAGFAIISRSFSQVFYKEIANIKDPVLLKKTYIGFMKKLSLISIFVIIVTYLIPQNFILFILGDGWDNLLPILKITVLWVSVQFISGSLSFIYIKLNKQNLMLWFDLIHLLIIIACLLIGHNLFHSGIKTLWFFTFGQIFYYLLAILLAIVFIKKTDHTL